MRIYYLNSSLSKKATPLRRSSRIRRAPVKCVCATCITTRANEDDDSASTSTTEHDPREFHIQFQIDGK